MLDEFRVSFRIRYFVMFAGLVAVAGAAIAYWRYVPGTEVKDLFGLVASGVAILALIYTALSFSLSNRIRLEEIQEQRIARSMEIIQKFIDPEMSPFVGRAARLREEIEGLADVEALDKIEGDDDARGSLITLLNFFEHVGLVVRIGAADEKILKEFFAVPISRYWVSFNSWILKKRRDVNTNQLFREIEFLSERWQRPD